MLQLDLAALWGTVDIQAKEKLLHPQREQEPIWYSMIEQI
jgi:hypothetical protein